MIGVWIFLSLLALYISGLIGAVIGYHECRKEAVKAGVGHWKVVAKTGQKYFHWGVSP